MTTKTDDTLIEDKSPDDWRLVYMPETDIEKASGICNVMRDRWFMVHPERGLLFYQSNRRRKGQLRGASAQCNTDKAVVERLRQELWPWAELRFYERVIVPIDLGDYR